MFTMKSELVGRPSVVSDDIFQSVGQKIRERRRFTVSELSCEFPQISRTVLYEITTDRLRYHHKFCARWVPKILTGAHEMQTMTSALIRLKRYHKDGDEFLSHIVGVTGDKTWASFVNVKTKKQPKQWVHTHSPKKPKNFCLTTLLTALIPLRGTTACLLVPT
jgi:hypothetical protein